MGKKKGKKSGKKKDGEADPKKQEMIKRLNTGYTKRLEKYHSQEPLPNVAAILKVAVKAAGEIPQLIFTSADLKGPHGSSRLLPLFEALKETGYPALREVFFWNTLIENNDVLVLANYLEKKQPDQNLTAVEFLDNAFTPFGCQRIGQALTFNKTITKLTINHNDIGDDGAIKLMQGLSLNQTLATLNLDYCEIGRDGAEAIGRGIATNTSVTEIFLNGNTVGASGAMLMAQGLRHNGTLTRLELRDNQVDQYGVVEDDEDSVRFIELLAECLLTNGTFAYLDLADNTIGDDGAAAVLKMYEDRKEKGLPGCNVRVDCRMSAENYAAIGKGTKWKDASGGGGGKKGGKKKGGKKKKKK